MKESTKKVIAKGIGSLTGTMASAMIHKLVKAAPNASLKDKVIVTVGTWGISLAVCNAVFNAVEKEVSSYLDFSDTVRDMLGKKKEEEDGRS